MSTPTTIEARHLRGRKCPECDEPLRLCQKGLTCSENHIFDKESDTWLDIVALIRWAQTHPVDTVVDAGFMMRESSGRAPFGDNSEDDK